MITESIQSMTHMLENMEGWMAKAAAHADQKKYDVNNLTQARLAPDMHPFTRQIQSASDAAKFAAAYLAGQTAPVFEDNEKTWNELRERMKKTVSYLKSFKPEDFKHGATSKVSPKWAQGQWMTGSDYVKEVALPNFYFHATMAYALLRHNGVDVGKMDFLGQVNMQGQRTP